jgi:hypothetical protein
MGRVRSPAAPCRCEPPGRYDPAAEVPWWVPAPGFAVIVGPQQWGRFGACRLPARRADREASRQPVTLSHRAGRARQDPARYAAGAGVASRVRLLYGLGSRRRAGSCASAAISRARARQEGRMRENGARGDVGVDEPRVEVRLLDPGTRRSGRGSGSVWRVGMEAHRELPGGLPRVGVDHDVSEATSLEALETPMLCHTRAGREGRAALVTDTIAHIIGQPRQTVAAWIAGRRFVLDPPRTPQDDGPRAASSRVRRAVANRCTRDAGAAVAVIGELRLRSQRAGLAARLETFGTSSSRSRVRRASVRGRSDTAGPVSGRPAAPWRSSFWIECRPPR